jgi:5-methylcytosine-specific restriction enzyme A
VSSPTARSRATRRSRLLADAKNPDSKAKGHCRFCGAKVVAPRKTFCSGGKVWFTRAGEMTDAPWGCVEEWKVRTMHGFLRRVVWARDRGKCAGCGKVCGNWRGPWVADHEVPLFKGGSAGLANVQTLCASPDGGCNAAKTAAERRVEPGFQPRWLTLEDVRAAIAAS